MIRNTLLALAATFFAPALAFAQQPPVRVLQEPAQSIGLEPGQELGEVTDAVRLPDGRLWVFDGFAQQIRVFGPDGRPQGSIGRTGAGPLEFLSVVELERAGDSVFVVDASNRRVSVLSSDGALLREIPTYDLPFIVGEAVRLADGTWVVRRENHITSNPRSGINRDTVPYVRLDAAFEEPRLVARVPGNLSVRWRNRRGTWNRRVPLSPMPWADRWGECVYLVATDRPRVSVLHGSGEPAVEFTFDAVPEPVTDAFKLEYYRHIVSIVPEGPEREVALREALAGLPAPTEMPVALTLHVDPYGFVWLQEFEPYWYGRSFRVLDSAGGDLGVVETPVDIRILEVGRDYLLGLGKGPLDESVVHELRIERSGPTPEPPAACAPV